MNQAISQSTNQPTNQSIDISARGCVTNSASELVSYNICKPQYKSENSQEFPAWNKYKVWRAGGNGD